MMKHTFTYIFLAMLALLGTLSCVRDMHEGDVIDGGEPGVKLLFSVGGLGTKAGISGEMDGEDEYYENDINRIDYFLYVTGSTGNALVSGHVDSDDLITASSRDGSTLLDAPAYSVNVGDGMLRSLFSGGANGSTCVVYIIANYPGTIDHSGDTSLEYLQSLAVSTTFKDTTPTEFVMDGQGVATMYDRSKTEAAEGIIEMKRIASKVTLEVHCVQSVVVENTVTSGGETFTQEITWRPMLSGIKANLAYGKQRGLLSGDEDTTAPTFKYTKTAMTVGDNDTTYHSIPFYSYPMTWHNGDEEAPYIKLELPWTTGSKQKQFYYKIPLAGQALEKNNWYHIVLNVAIIGGEDFEAGVEISGQYYVVPWETQLIVQAEAEIVDARYLTVPRNSYTLYNQEELSFTFNSSHDCVIKDVTFTKPDYSGSTVTTTTLLSSSGNSNAASSFYLNTASGDSLKVNERVVTFTHALNNTVGTGLDIAPYTLTFTICHEDAMDSYYETVTIIQEPAIVIQAKANSGDDDNYGYAFVNGVNGSYTSTTERDSYTGGNGYSNYASNWEYYLGSSPAGLGNSSNTNTNMYVIKTSVLSSDSDYILGDPRTTSIDLLLPDSYENNWSKSAAAVDGTTRSVQYYYPANTDASANNMIAPEFRIASSYGATYSVTFENAQRRCAAYQEDGYPAGRWRLPTVAEITYISQLTSYNLIPRLLGASTTTGNSGATSDYWCNSGYMTVYNGTGVVNAPVYGSDYTSTETKSVRCVYDDWYWNNSEYPTVDKTSFKWGDVAR